MIRSFLIMALVVVGFIFALNWTIDQLYPEINPIVETEPIIENTSPLKKAEPNIESSIEPTSQALSQMQALCLICHSAKESHEEQMKALGPPMWGVRDHYLEHYPDENTFVKAITDFVREPSIEKSHMKGAVKRFGVMQPLALPREQLEAIARHIYRAEGFTKPSWWDEHMQEHRSAKVH